MIDKIPTFTRLTASEALALAAEADAARAEGRAPCTTGNSERAYR